MISTEWPSEALENAVSDALETITPSDARGWFRHAGYMPN